MLVYYQSKFSLDTINEALASSTPFTGYTDGERWNGWATPVFPKAEAEKVVAALNAAYDKNPSWKEDMGLGRKDAVAWYDSERDAYVTASENEPGEVDEWDSIDININAETIRVYPIGTMYWTWIETTEK